MSETKAAFAEKVIQSLKHKVYRYTENHGEKFIHKLPPYVSPLNCRINRSIGKPPRDVKNTAFLSFLYNKILLRFRKLKFKVEDGVRISKNDITFRKGYKPQFTLTFLKFRQYLQTNLLHTSSKISTKKKSWENFMKKS